LTSAAVINPVGPDPQHLREAIDRRDARREARQTAKEKSERKASRTKYWALDRSEATAVGRRHFKQVFDRRDSLQREGVRVNAYLGAHAARVELESGRKALVESLSPLQTPDQAGRLAPVDLSLRDAGSSWEPAQGLAEISLPKRLRAGGVFLKKSGVRVEIASPQSDSVGSAEDGGAFYANAETDTDVAVVPQLTGVEVSWLLRSAQSPEQFSLRYTGGVTLRDRDDGAVEVLRDGQVVAGIAVPMAWDADHEPVAMSMHGDGDTLYVTVKHRDQDVLYPIVADPSITEKFYWSNFMWSNGSTASGDTTGWSRVSTRVIRQPLGVNCDDTNKFFCFGSWSWIYGPGIYTYQRDDPAIPGYDRTYNYGDMGEWIFQAPGDSYIWRVDMLNMKNEYDSSCSYQGIFSPRTNNWESQSWWDPYTGEYHPSQPAGSQAPRIRCGADTTDWLAICSGQSDCNDGAANTTAHVREAGNYAVFGTQIFKPQVPSFTNYLGAAHISIGDRDRPTITSATNSLTGYVRTGTGTITPSATDSSLGVKKLRLQTTSTTGGANTQEQVHPCAGDHTDRCPATWNNARPSWTPSFTYNVDSLPEGTNRFGLQAVDLVGNANTGTDTSAAFDPNVAPAVIVDRTPPAFSADFQARATRDPATGNAVIDWDPGDDVPLATGEDGSGTVGYLFSYVKNGGTPSDAVPVSGQMTEVPGPTVMGDSFLVRVQARDAVGNLSSVVSATATVTDSAGACRGTTEGVPAACISDETQDDDSSDAGATLDPYSSPDGRSAATDVFRINVNGGWTTIRRNLKSFVIGNAHDGDLYKRIRRDYSGTLGYTTGFVYGDFNSCGWVKAENVQDTGVNDSTNCAPGFQFAASEFMVAANCLPRGPGEDPRCKGGTDIVVIKEARACANVSPNFPAVPVKCEGSGGRTYFPGKHLNWRYVTKGRKYTNFVLVNDPDQPAGQLNWVFVPRAAFRAKLCGDKYGCGQVGT